ncbi:alkaline phosphatase family protein [Halobellus rufus]|uniref:alkaline phosphatase family protein n=1 Tax=Halobellus rufus TaxID=1448860 RepID=UPI00067888FD|nr:alkaline phosphatase family protein [Halobellus rufus]
MSETGATGPRTLVIGIDALSRDVLSRLSKGTAPTIESILASGASGPLESQLPPWTPSAWPSIYTGVNPGKHGVYGFLRFDGYDWDVVNSTDVRERSIWELCSAQGLTSVVVNVPVTHPPPTFEGALIPGYTAPEDPECHPPGLLAEVRDAVGEYRLYNRQLREGASKADRIDGYEELVEMRGKAFRYLLDREDPDFAFLQFQQSDTVFHEFPDGDAPDRVYAAIDAEIEATMDAFPPETVVLVSDHGIGPCSGYEIRPNALLRDRGDVVTTTDGEKPSWSDISTRRLRAGDETDVDSTDDGPSAVERALAAAAGVGLTSQRIGTVLRKLRLDGLVLQVVSADLVAAAEETVDFPNSTAYLRDRIELGVRLNLEGREPDGTVGIDEYRERRADIADAFESLRTPDGEPAFEAVLPREDVFHGPYVDDAPDLLLVPNEFEHTLSASIREETFGSPREPWTHKRDGIVAVAGSGVDPVPVEDAHLFDVAPTVLATLGVPVSDRMDGAVLPVVEDPGSESYPPYRGEKVPTRDADVETRLADLGYLE